MMAMEIQVRRAEMPVTLRNQVKATPSPQIVVRNVRQEIARTTLYWVE